MHDLPWVVTFINKEVHPQFLSSAELPLHDQFNLRKDALWIVTNCRIMSSWEILFRQKSKEEALEFLIDLNCARLERPFAVKNYYVREMLYMS
jgi:hypothetical protein